VVDDNGASLGGDCSSSSSKGRDGRGNFHRGCRLKLVLVGCSCNSVDLTMKIRGYCKEDSIELKCCKPHRSQSVNFQRIGRFT
jgi:hypothetical protein